MTNRNTEARYEIPEQGIPWMIEQWVRLNVHTVSLGTVDSYDPETKRARIQPILRTLFNDGTEPEKKPIILNVPLRQPASGSHMVHHQVDAGDVVLLLFSSRGLNAVKEQWGEISDPDRGVYFQMRDALAIPWGVENIEPARTTGWVVQNADGMTYISVDGPQVRIFSGHTQVIVQRNSLIASVDGDASITSTGTVRIVGNAEITGNLAVGGDLTNKGVDVGGTHTHPGVQPGGGNTGPPT